MELTRKAYGELLAEDLEWLLLQPRTLEREHIADILRHEMRRRGEPAQQLAICVECGRTVEFFGDHWRHIVGPFDHPADPTPSPQRTSLPEM